MPNNFRTEFTGQRYTAKCRGIEFLLTYAEWLSIWIESGYLPERGREKGQYQMARFNDTGPYAVGNVKIVTVEENRSEQKMTTEHCSRAGVENGMAKLTDDVVLELRQKFKNKKAIVGLKKLAGHYHVDRVTIRQAIRGKTWKHL